MKRRFDWPVFVLFVLYLFVVAAVTAFWGVLVKGAVCAPC